MMCKAFQGVNLPCAEDYAAVPHRYAADSREKREHFMLTEYTTPGTSAEVRDDESIYSLLTERIERTGEDTIIAARKIGPGRWANVTTGEFRQAVVAAAKGLIAFGVKQGDAVTIFSTTRYEWGVLDFALAAIGAVSVPIYDTDSAAQAERILNDSEVKLAIADNRERFDRLDWTSHGTQTG